MTEHFQFDRTRTSCFVGGSTIFYSPNSNRKVETPPLCIPIEPSNKAMKMTRDDFKEPVWWTEEFAWIGYIPLAPLFTAYPFEPLCWLPKVVKTSEASFVMEEKQLMAWNEVERLLETACRRIKLWYGIAARTPRLPSSFSFTRAHKSARTCQRQIHIAREWFVVWFGYLSYLITEADKRQPASGVDAMPNWYTRLKHEAGYSDVWLSGLLASSVCTFSWANPRVGLFIDLEDHHPRRPHIHHFLNKGIPLWLSWTKRVTTMFAADPYLRDMSPEDRLIVDAVALVYRSPIVPSAKSLWQKYLATEIQGSDVPFALQLKHAPSAAESYLLEKLMQEHSSPSLVAPGTEKPLPPRVPVPSYPQQGMIDKESFTGSHRAFLVSSIQDYFHSREQHRVALLETESHEERTRRLNRSRQPPIKNSRVFQWEEVMTSGGLPVYARLLVPKAQNEDVMSHYGPKQRMYDAFANEWDLCHEFCPDDNLEDDYGSDADDGSTGHLFSPSNFHIEGTGKMVSSSASPSQMHYQHETPGHVDGEDDLPFDTPDILVTLAHQYGYTSPLDSGESRSDGVIPFGTLVRVIGFTEIPPGTISEYETRAITSFLSAMVTKKRPEADLWDLDINNRANLAQLARISSDVARLTGGIFLFKRPLSSSCQWMLGVKSAVAALYVFRIFVSNPTHNLLTVAHMLLKHGVPFHSLLRLPRRHLVAPTGRLLSTVPMDEIRFVDYTFTPADFEAAMVRCQQILSLPHGRAAMLMGGLIWRIASMFMSPTDVLRGPSVEVSRERQGYRILDGNNDGELWDDQLSIEEIKVVTGSYRIRTGRGGQETTKSWFPPHDVWTAETLGIGTLQWTQYHEEWFRQHLHSIRLGDFQPVTRSDWMGKLRGFYRKANGLKYSRTLISYNEQVSADFIAQHITYT